MRGMADTYTFEAFRDYAHAFAEQLQPNPDGAVVVALHGELGAGKTTFVQQLAKAFGVVDDVISPTFVIQKRYSLGAEQSFERLVHIDAYRLERASELEALDWGELVADSQNLIVIEWAERVADILPPDTQHLTFTYVGEETRAIEHG